MLMGLFCHQFVVTHCDILFILDILLEQTTTHDRSRFEGALWRKTLEWAVVVGEAVWKSQYEYSSLDREGPGGDPNRASSGLWKM